MADESPLDRFKQALTGAARAIAHEPEADVAWTADVPAMQGKAMRVPMPGRNLPADAAREARGFADSFALRLRHHNEAMHLRGMPAEPGARAAYDAIERVRYEALGENNYAGMRENLASATDLRTRSDPISRA
ncbi:MAG TPA: cobaltochelatase subunit CobT, partial [Croceibacterium sp.]|nr:cobaltochelatase subunit CobT [Croceibacterium sp.]